MSMRTVAILAITAAAACAHAAGPNAYSVLELPPLSTSAPCSGQPRALSPKNGLAVGQSCRANSGGSAPALWNVAGGVRALQAPKTSGAETSAVNERGQASGTIYDADLQGQAVQWSSNGRVTKLQPLVEGDETQAQGISARGDVVGYERSNASQLYVPILWRNHTASALALPAGQVEGFVEAVSSKGVMAGRSYGPDRTTPLAALWRGGTVLAVGPKDSSGTDVNDAGQVVGEYRPSPQVTGAFLATSTSTTILPMSRATAINNAGVVVGDQNGSAVRWINGSLQQLTDLLDTQAKAAGWSIYYANDIDEEGRIIATGSRAGGNWTSVLLIPADH